MRKGITNQTNKQCNWKPLINVILVATHLLKSATNNFRQAFCCILDSLLHFLARAATTKCLYRPNYRKKNEKSSCPATRGMAKRKCNARTNFETAAALSRTRRHIPYSLFRAGTVRRRFSVQRGTFERGISKDAHRNQFRNPIEYCCSVFLGKQRAYYVFPPSRGFEFPRPARISWISARWPISDRCAGYKSLALRRVSLIMVRCWGTREVTFCR